MEIKGKIVLFSNDVQVGEKVVRNFCSYINAKQKDDSYIKMPVKVKFAGEKFSDDKLAKLDPNEAWHIEVKDGFVSCESWNDKKTNQTRYSVVYVIKDAKVLEHKPINKNSSDNPF